MRNHVIVLFLLSAFMMLGTKADVLSVTSGTSYASASEPEKPIIVITDNTTWLFKDGRWMPCTNSHGGRFAPVDEANTVIRFLIEHTNKHRYLEDESKPLTNEIILFCENICDFSPKRTLSRTNIVKIYDVDLSKELTDSDYIGDWKPVWGMASYGEFYSKIDSTELCKRYLLKIRPDHKRIIFDKYYKVDPWNSGLKDEYEVADLTPFGAGFHNSSTYGAITWYDKHTHLLYEIDSTSITAYERTNETFEDPLERCKAMYEKKEYHGAWGINKEFNILILSFDRSGQGSMTFFMGGVLFDWKVEGEDIICTFDSDTLTLAGGEWKTMTCRYDPSENKMAVVSLDGDTTPNSFVGESYELLSWEVQVKEFVEQIEEMKKRPEWRIELERAKRRQKRNPLK